MKKKEKMMIKSTCKDRKKRRRQIHIDDVKNVEKGETIFDENNKIIKKLKKKEVKE